MKTAFALAFGVIVVLACGARARAEPLCEPGLYVYCRCRDRHEGSKVCSEDGQSYGPCEPCQTADNPEIPVGDDPSSPDSPYVTPSDAGRDATTAACGDGVVQLGEDCDDANDVDSDGCSRTCKLAGEAPPLSNACGGVPVHVWGGPHTPTITVATAGAADHALLSDCGPSTRGASSPDRVFQVIAHARGTMRVTSANATFDSLLYASNACSPKTIHAVACANARTGNGDETLSFAVEADRKYFVFLDGAGGSVGKARLTFAIE